MNFPSEGRRTLSRPAGPEGGTPVADTNSAKTDFNTYLCSESLLGTFVIAVFWILGTSLLAGGHRLKLISLPWPGNALMQILEWFNPRLGGYKVN